MERGGEKDTINKNVKTLKVAYANVNGIISARLQIINFLRVSEVDITCFVKTWL